jgi:hypothetical protein
MARAADANGFSMDFSFSHSSFIYLTVNAILHNNFYKDGIV